MATGDVCHPGRDIQQGGPEYQRRKDSRNGLPPVPGSGNAVGGGIWAADDRSRAFLTGEATCLGAVHIVRGVDGAWFSGSPSTDTEWEGNGWETALGDHAPRRGATYLQGFLTNRRGTMELYS